MALHPIGASALLSDLRQSFTDHAARLIRWIAGASFSLYVMHYPVLHLLDATLHETLPAYNLWLLGLTLAACFGFAQVFERPLKFYRQWLTQAVARRVDAA